VIPDDTHQQIMIGAAATLQHIENLHNRMARLEVLRIEAEEQLLHRAAVAFQAGQLRADGLSEICDRYKALPFPGRMTRWNEIMPVNWHRMHELPKWQPNGPAGTWVGSWPIGKADQVPAPKAFVLYVLFDSHNEPIYVGSTGNFRTRLKTHFRQGKPFVRWQAYAVADREAAYQLEEKLLRERLPRFNKKAGR